MNNPYDLHSWSKHYREEALREASTRRLLEQARAQSSSRNGKGRYSATLKATLSLLISRHVGVRLARTPGAKI
jgi:hypothetical protein